MKKKGDANMWWIIIGAVVALVVLIVLMVIFTGKTGRLEGGLSECSGKGGACVSSSGNCPRNTLRSSAFDCGSGEQCCIGAAKRCSSDAECGVDGLCAVGYCYSR